MSAVEQQLLWNAWGRLPGFIDSRGQRLTIPGRTITDLAFRLSAVVVGAPQPPAVYAFYVERVSDGVIIGSTAAYNYSNPGAVPIWPASGWLNWPLLAPVTYTGEVRIYCLCTWGIFGFYELWWAYQNTDVKPGEVYTHRVSIPPGPWVDEAAQDAAYIYTYLYPAVTTLPATGNVL